MSLCFATITLDGLLISSDGRGVLSDDRGNLIKVSDNIKKLFKINDNLMVFISGSFEPNMEVVHRLENINSNFRADVNSIANTISWVSKVVYEEYKMNNFDAINQWEKELQLDDSERLSSIPINITAFFYSKNEQKYYLISLSPKNDFSPEIVQLNNRQTVIKGWQQEVAKILLRKNVNRIKSLDSEIKRFKSVYQQMEKEFVEVGGNIVYFLMQDSLSKELKVGTE